jgi:hypothetical protein
LKDLWINPGEGLRLRLTRSAKPLEVYRERLALEGEREEFKSRGGLALAERPEHYAHLIHLKGYRELSGGELEGAPPLIKARVAQQNRAPVEVL